MVGCKDKSTSNVKALQHLLSGQKMLCKMNFKHPQQTFSMVTSNTQNYYCQQAHSYVFHMEEKGSKLPLSSKCLLNNTQGTVFYSFRLCLRID